MKQIQGTVKLTINFFGFYFQFDFISSLIFWVNKMIFVKDPLDFPGGSVVKNLPAMQETQETQVWSLGWEDPLEEEMTTHASFLTWKIPWTEEPGGLQPMGLQRV